MPNESKMKEYAKIGGIVGGIILSSTSLVNQHNDTSTYEVRMKALEMNIESYGKWRDKVDEKVDNSSKEIYTMNVQLAQVLVKMDNVIEALKELKNTGKK